MNQTQPNQSSQNPVPSQHTTDSHPTPSTPQEQLDPNNEIVQGMQHQEETILELMQMGFEREEVKQSLSAAYFNKERAVDYLLNVI